MTKRSLILIGVAVVLGLVYAWYSDFFRAPEIDILAQVRPSRKSRAPAGDTPVDPVSFAFRQKISLASVRVVSAEDEKTNKFPHELWHLISDSNSVPVKVISYGESIRGMKPKVPRARPEPLEPDVIYRLYIQAADGSKGNKKFHTREAVRPQ
jgi:hypothetical protein